LVEEGLANCSAVSIPGRPMEISCCHNSRIAVAYRPVSNTPLNSTPHTNSQPSLIVPPTLFSSPYMNPKPSLQPILAANQTPSTSPNSASNRDSQVHISVFQCESTGGSQWVFEQTLVLDSAGFAANAQGPHADLSVPHENGLSCSGKNPVHLDWVSQEDGAHILTVGMGTKLYMYGPLSGKPPELCMSSSSSERNQRTSRLVLLRTVELVSSVEGSAPLPVSLSWVRDGILVVGMDCEMHVYSQWQPPAPPRPAAGSANHPDNELSSSMSSILSAVRQSQEEALSPGSGGSTLAPPKRGLTRSMTSLAQKLSGKRTAYDLPMEMEDFGLFEAAHQLFPTLPQYHPVQLMELMDLGKVVEWTIHSFIHLYMHTFIHGLFVHMVILGLKLG